jgi:predicted RNase H-like nuclease (RuvC/YqgF family)
MVSVSTVAAGPSVQLVERMSATVRRLESELAAIREEITSVQSQRDDARKEVVEMVREVEEARGRAARITELEREVDELRRREEYTLEMLGEKSERVEELKQDVQDLKLMYRDLVSSTVG